jgi:predicted MFS family arabinose efflux permease
VLRVALNNRQFGQLWIAQVISQSGDWLNRVACLALIGTLGGKTAQWGVGALFGAELALRLVPSAIFGPLAGPVADRVPRRLLMVAADIGRAVVVLGLLFVREADDLPWLYVLIAMQTAIAIFFEAARTAALPATVPPEDLHAAYALSAVTWSVTLSVGALVGGWLVSWIGVQGAFAVDAASYVASAACLFHLRLPPVPIHPEPFRWRDVIWMTEMRRGLAHLRELRITPVVFTKTFWGAAGGLLVLLAIAGNERFGEGHGADTIGAAAFTTGALYSARGLGTALGPVLARWRYGSSDSALRSQITAGFVVAAFGYAAFGASDRLDVACFFVGVAHMGGSALWVASTVFWQKHVDDAFRGRVFALEFFGMDVAFATGGMITGFLYDRTRSMSTTVWIVSAAVLVLGIAWTWLARGVAPQEASSRPVG